MIIRCSRNHSPNRRASKKSVSRSCCWGTFFARPFKSWAMDVFISSAAAVGTTWIRIYKSIRKVRPCDVRSLFARQREQYCHLARLNGDRVATVDALRSCTSALPLKADVGELASICPLCVSSVLTHCSKSLSTRSPLWRTRGRMMKPALLPGPWFQQAFKTSGRGTWRASPSGSLSLRCPNSRTLTPRFGDS